MSPSCSTKRVHFSRRLLAGRGVERLDHFVCDVVLGVDVHSFLENHIVFFCLSNQLDCTVCALNHHLLFFIFACVKVFLKFTGLGP
ncbi:MAG: hypothetical protein RL770_303 [Pseudomonadota bacterium]